MAQNKPDIHRLIELHRFLLQFQQVERVVDVPHKETFRSENDVEHSYHLAMAAWFLCAYFPHLNRDTVIRYALAHDLVEVHAGDTYIYADQAALDSKQSREHAALKQIKQEWTDFPELVQTIETYEAKADAEALFVYALDKIMPIIVIFIGEGYTWQREGITTEQLDRAKRHKVRVSPEIEPYYEQLYDLLTRHGHYFSV